MKKQQLPNYLNNEMHTDDMAVYDTYKKIGDEIARKIAKCPKIKAVAYVGSMASGFVDEISKDIDIACIIDQPLSIEERRKYLGKQKYDKTISNVFFENFKVGDIGIDIIFKDKTWYENVLKRLEPVDEFNEKHILFQLQTMKPIVDKENTLKSLKERAEYTDDYRKRKVEFLFATLCRRKYVMSKPLKRNDSAYLNYLFSETLEKYAGTIYALNKRYYSDLKWSEKFIEQFKIKPENSINYIKKISEIGNKPKEIKKKLNLLKEMVLGLSETIKKEVPKAKIDESLKRLEKW